MFKDQTVLITGPTSGIGRELAELFARDGAHLILVSRNLEKLHEISDELRSRYSIRIELLAQDLSLPGSPEKLVQQIKDKRFSVDVLVNNAGYGVYGKFFEEAIGPQMGMIQLHTASLTYLTHAFLRSMLQKGRGGILNVASTGGFQAVPIENVYCSTKAYVVHFTEALAEELRDTPIRVTCFCPGPTQTPFFDTPLMKSSMPVKLSRMGAKTVAQMGYDAFKKGRRLEITGLRNKIMVLGVKLAPRSVVTKIARRIVEKKFQPKKQTS